MATATKKDRRAKHVTLRAADVSDPAGFKFLVYEDNRGQHRWEILGRRGESLAQSVSYATRDDAEQAARAVQDLAGAARFEPTRQDLTTTSEVVRVAS
ncbi:MAG TPA: DUF1508 domain-containing protein [Solirubrobacteraceae bacterium]|nr:DUF1508 domain-containing protein [Solirubrobacteraceae bacterium]